MHFVSVVLECLGGFPSSHHHTSECVARVPVSLSGVWGLRVCSLDVAFTFVTVRSRPREGHMAVSMVCSAKGALLEAPSVA